MLINVLLIILILFISNNAFCEQATLAWEPPETYTDNTPMTDLAFFKIYSGTNSGCYNNIEVSITPQITITNLQAGQRYYFSVSAVTSNEVEGDLSEEFIWDVPFPNSCISIVSSAGGDFVLKWIASAGKIYLIETSQDLVQWELAFRTHTALTDGALMYCDTNTIAFKQKFFRLQVVE